MICQFCGVEQKSKSERECCIKNYYYRLKQSERITKYRHALWDGIAAGYLTADIADYTFAKSDTTENDEAVAQARAAKGNLYLFGTPGSGKTHTARCLLTFAAYNGASIAECSAPAAVREITQFQTSATQVAIMGHRVVLIDDLDKLNHNSHTLTALWELLDARSTKNKRTIVTCNSSPAELVKQLRSFDTENKSVVNAALDRLHPLTVVEFKGKSLRRKQ